MGSLHHEHPAREGCPGPSGGGLEYEGSYKGVSENRGGVLVIRILLFRGTILGSPIFGNSQKGSFKGPRVPYRVPLRHEYSEILRAF